MLKKEEIQNLIFNAKDAMKNAYSPYSKFKVGCALLTKNGKIYKGCNVENISFGGTICAERTAFLKAISEGEREFIAAAVVGSDGDFTYPCGLCRQFMAEFGLDIHVIVNNEKEIKLNLLKDLLPNAFTAASLK